MITYGLDNQDSFLFPILIVFLEYGIAASFTIIYTAHNSIFPVLFSATALGLCNFVSRVFAAAAPVVATVDQPIPLLVFMSLSVSSAFSVWMLRPTHF